MWWQTIKILSLNYPDKYKKIGFTGCLHLWWSLLLCRTIINGFHPTTHKVSLWFSRAIIPPKTRTFRYSHHLNQSALCESDGFFRVSRCNITWILIWLYTLQHHHESRQETYEIMSSSYHIHVPTPSPHVIS